MKISVITAVYNSANTIRDAIESVIGQSGSQIEYIVVDGMSTDGTAGIVEEYRDRIDVVIREPDNGIYEALNKGVLAATGEVIGFLHADDVLANSRVLANVQAHFQNSEIDGVYGDLVYVDQANTNRVVRYWNAGPFRREKFSRGWMPPHPTVYLRRNCYERYGTFNLEMATAADYELLIRMMVKNEIQVDYIPQVLYRMRVGGKSNRSLKNRLRANQDDRLAWLQNGLRPPFGLRLMKPLRKLHQFFPILSKPPTET